MPLLADSLRQLSASLLIMAIVIAALVLGRDLFIPLAAAVVIAFILAPVVRWLAARGVPQPVAAVGVLAMAIMLIVGLSFAFSAQLLSLTAELDSYKQNLVAKVRTVADYGRSDGMLKRAATAVETLGTEIERELGRGAAAPQTNPVVVAQQPQGTPAEILNGVSNVLFPLAQLGITILFAMLLLLQHHDIRDRLVKIAGTDRMSGTAAAISDAGSKLSELFLALAMMNAGYGFVIGVALWIIGVPNPLLWGLLAMVMRFVPFAGPILAAIPPIALAAAVDPGWGTMLAAVALFGTAELIVNNVVEPFVLGRRAGITAFGMATAAAFWTVVWGPIGLLLSAPLTTTIVVFGHHIRGLEFISVMFGDQPALDPAQELYHRLLAGDPVAAAATIAEEGDDLSLVQISDSLVLPALKLAAYDYRHQRIDSEQADGLRETMREAADLSFEAPDDADTGMVSRAAARPTVCVIPARGTVDHTAAEHVAFLVTRQTPCRAVVATRSSGLTAIADLRAMKDYENIDTLIIATVGGVDSQQLPLISRRAVRDFPEANHFVLALDEKSSVEREGTPTTERGGRIHTKVGPIIAALECAPLRRESEPAVEPQAADDRDSRVVRSA